MKHRVAFRKLRRPSAHRWAMLRTMVSQLVLHERIETTVPKAKELRRIADQMVTLGKDGSQHARRQAMAVLRGEEHTHKVFTTLADRYRERDGGYTRVLRTQHRTNDAAPMAFIEFVDRAGELRPARPARAVANLLPPAAEMLAAQARK